MSKGRYVVRSHRELVTPLHQIWDTELDKPAKHCWFWVRREDAQAVIDDYERTLESEREGVEG